MQFIHGTTYYHFAHPSTAWDEDFARMRAMGLNAVRVAEIWPGWEVLEPEPGVYDFAELDEYVRAASAAGIDVIMGIGVNNPPFWVFHEIPDLRTRDVSGEVAVRRVQGANHDHPVYREYMGRFVAVQAEHYAQVPGITAWQFGNEVRYRANIADNECTRARFRQWLRGQYDDDLDRLNREWGVHFYSWEEIYPYLSPEGAPTEGLSPLAIASRAYQAWSLAEWVEWGTAIIRCYSDLPVFHNNHGQSGSYSHWDISKPSDIVVQDIYPATSTQPQIYNTGLLDCAVSVARSLGKELWIGETGVGQYGTYQRIRPPQALIETLVMEMIGCGIKGLLYFRHRPPKYEQPHKYTGSGAALRLDGSALEYVRTPAHVSLVMDRLGERILACEPELPQVATYYGEESVRFSRDAGYSAIQRASIFGTTALWNRAAYPVHVLNTETLLAEDLSQFKLIYLPTTYLLPSAVGDRLCAYVAAGGTLVSECRPAYVGEDGWMYLDQPGAGLHEVFGAREDLFWNAAPFEAEVYVGEQVLRLTTSGVCQTYRLAGGEAIAWNTDGEVIGVQHRLGKGRAILFGFAPSLLFPVGGSKYEGSGEGQAIGEANQRTGIGLVRALAGQTGVSRPVDVQCDSVQVAWRYLRSDRERLVFCCNHGPETIVSLPVSADAIARGADGDVSFETARGEVSVPSLSWLICAAPRQQESARGFS